MLDAFNSPTFVKLAAATAALVVIALMCALLVVLVRLGRTRDPRRGYSDLPELIHGPQELVDHSETRSRRPTDDPV